MTKLYVRPLPEHVGKPGGYGLPAEGAEVPRSGDAAQYDLGYWLRRVRFGDVVKCDPPEADPDPAPKKRAKKDPEPADDAGKAEG